MPKRISFHVVYATSEDSSYPACELNNQGPAARGWRSIGAPPHELLIRLTSVARVHKLQLLAHHQLIPSWVEVLVSGGLMSEGAATPCGATYTSVGKVELAPPNAQAGVRELRSAVLPEPTVARFVKLRMSGPHPPAGNFDQVALMAVNVLGEVLEEVDGATIISDTYSPYDDLSFVMYVDNEIADLIRLLDEKKKIAVVEERFEYARRLKSAGAALTTAGARIGRWRLRKRTAAVRDDFELARRMRDRISDALISIKEDADLSRLMEENGVNPKNDSSMPQEYDFSNHLSASVLPETFSMEVPSPVPPIDPEPGEIHEEVDGLEAGEVNVCDEDEENIVKSPVHQETEAQLEEVFNIQEDKLEISKKIEEEELRKETDSPRRSVTPNNGYGVMVRRRNKSAGPRTTFEAYEDRPLPTLRHSHTNEYLKEPRDDEGSAAGSTSSHQRPPHKMNEKERKQAALPILIFGEPLVEKFYSKTFIDKEDGLTRLKSELTSPTNGSGKTSPNKTARATATLLQRSLRDKVFSVYCQANELVKVLFLEFMPERVCAAEVGRCLEKLLPELLRACGDPAPRVHSMAQHTVLTVADCPHVRSLHIIPQQLVRPVPASIHPRLALSRLQMLEQLVLNHGISTEKNSGLTVRRLAECGAAGAQHASGAVRAAAERILVTVYKRSPRVVRAQLPPDDAVTRRNLIYRHLFQQFDKIDMQKMLNQAPSEDTPQDDQTDPLDSASISQSCRSTTISGMTSSYSLKSLASSVSGVTLAPSSFSGSSTKTKSSLKKVPLRKYTPGKGSNRDLSIGYNKLRLDSAVSPKHSPRSSLSGGEKVHFEDSIKKDVVMRRSNRNSENRHSMIHYDHESSKPRLKERPITVYEPLHLSYTDSPTIESPRTSKMDLRMDSLNMDSPRDSRSIDSEYRSLDSPRVREYYNSNMDSPKSLPLKNLNLDDTPMDESGYYSPGDTGRKQLVVRSKSGNIAEFGDSFETGGVADVSSDGTTPEPVCNTSCSWCGRRVRAGGLETHYWRRCVLLARCPHCQTALEARTLHAHLLEECSLSDGAWKQCKKCGAALKIEDKNNHVNCIPLGLDEWKCPYCLTNVLARDLPWQRHLMQCPRNPRRNPQTLI